MTNRDHAMANRDIRKGASPFPYKAMEPFDRKHTPGPAKRRAAIVLTFSLLSLFIAGRPSYANLPPAMHSPQGALDVAGALPGRYGLLDRQKQPIGPTEATVSSVKAIAGLMKQAIDVAAMLPKEGTAKVATQRPEVAKPETTKAEAPLAVASVQKAPAPKTPMEAALHVACCVPQLPAAMTASQIRSARSFLWPTDGLIYSTFGASRGRRAHGAIDIVTKKGTPIAAAESGTVIIAANGGKLFRGYGKIVIIDHGKGVHTVYSHCDTLLVKMGQQVKRGEFIGTVGRTGRATTDHCHFEVRVAGKKVDPLKYLPDRPEMVKANNWKSSSKKKAN